MRTALIFLLLFGCVTCSRRDVTTLSIKGSDTEVNVVLELAEAFMARDSAVSVSVTGGGSGMGIAALINQKTDIANSSRAFEPDEIKLARQRQVQPVATVFAVDALAFVVHSSLPVDELSLKQIGGIFRGDITNWQQVGGPNARISLYGRQSNSGTYVYLRESLLQADYSPRMKQMNGSAQIVEAVRNDRFGIGYVGIGYVADQQGRVSSGLNVLAVSEGNKPAVSPLQFEKIISGEYPVVRPLYQYTNGRPSGKELAFMRFELDSVGQAIIRKNGYFAVSERYRPMNQKNGLVP